MAPPPIGGGSGFGAQAVIGAVARVAPEDFQRILDAQPAPLVVLHSGGWWRTTHRYLTSYKGICFCTQSAALLPLPVTAEVVQAKMLSIPGLWS